MQKVRVNYMNVSSRLEKIIKEANMRKIQYGVVPLINRPILHDLFNFLVSRTKEMEDEYNRIQTRTLEDPGTAGDQGEENWKSLLKSWLPPMFHIVTKGRIISTQGFASPQVDILVLHPTYPENLRDKKLYLAAGVIAAFECKITLKTEHIKKAIENSILIKEHVSENKHTLFKELHNPILYGILSHSHNWKKPNSDALTNVYDNLFKYDLDQVKHPSQMLDLLCVADLGLWNSCKHVITQKTVGSKFIEGGLDKMFDGQGICATGYLAHNNKDPNQVHKFSPIGAMLTELLIKIAWRNPDVRPIAQYFLASFVSGSGKGVMRQWPLTVLSDPIRKEVISGRVSASNPFFWDEWKDKF